ncbi:MAG: histidinol-phosphatase HisJ family protein [Eubacteriales bacterium]|nr:histidinol-phosphatase HisJ family protein [Eubacteriales bacterium]
MQHKILWDCHMHSSFSADSDTPMQEMAKRAQALGLSGICFTEHLDPDYPDTPEKLSFSLDVPAYHRSLCQLREAFPGLSIRFGIELGLQIHLAEDFHSLLKQHPFDFVIGSSHVVHGMDPYYPDFFQGRRVWECYMEYFESILENLSFFDQMDVYGHLDYVVRYGPGKNAEYSYGRFQDILDAILKKMVEKGIGLELNTGGYHYGLGHPNPHPSVLKRYRQLGGEIVTIGADAHAPSKVAFAFAQGASVLRECGFSYYAVFRERKPEFFPI